MSISRALALADLTTAGLTVDIRTYGAVADGSTDCSSALASALATGKRVFIPETSSSWYMGTANITIPSGAYIYGSGVKSKITISTSTLNPLFDLSTNDDISIIGLNMVGNGATQSSVSTGSNAITSSPGCSGITIAGCVIQGWARHGICLDGVTDAFVSNNKVSESYQGAGILCSNTAVSNNVKVIGNTVRNTQLANIHAFVEIHDWFVADNFCDTSDWNHTGTIADNITGYDASNSRISVIGNTCLNSGNHGMHIGGDHIVIEGNKIKNPTFNCICSWKEPNALPTVANYVTIVGNTCENSTHTDGTKGGISVRNCLTPGVNNNLIATAYFGVELYGIFGVSVGIDGATVTGNRIFDTSIGVRCRKRTVNSIIGSNTIRNSTQGVVLGNDTGDGHSLPSQYNVVCFNIFNNLSGASVLEETSGDFNKISYNYDVGTTPGTYTTVGGSTVVKAI
jgi:hypothetical protein